MDLVNFSSQTHQGPFLNQNEDGYDFVIFRCILFIRTTHAPIRHQLSKYNYVMLRTNAQ